MTVLSLVTPQGQCRALRAKSMATSFANLATHRFTCRSLPLHLFHFFIRLFRCLEAFVSFSFPHFTSPFLGYLPFSWDIPALSALLFSRLEYFPSISITLCFKSSTACPTTWRNLLETIFFLIAFGLAGFESNWAAQRDFIKEKLVKTCRCPIVQGDTVTHIIPLGSWAT